MKSYTFIFCMLLAFGHARIHELNVTNDVRNYISITSFGFYQYGYLNVTLKIFTFQPIKNTSLVFGFTLEKIVNDAIDPHMEMYRETCLLDHNNQRKAVKNRADIVFFIMNLKENKLQVNCSTESSIAKLLLYEDPKFLPDTSVTEDAFMKTGKQSDTTTKPMGHYCSNFTLPIVKENDAYSAKFAVYVPTEAEEGLYELFFHSCANYEELNYGEEPHVKYSFSMDIEEHNVNNYLSAGDMPLPALYFMMSNIFSLSSIFWIYILIKSRHPVYKIHYLMATLVVLKTLGLLFHGINYHYIEIRGQHLATWAILYYVTHVLKGLLLFITIILIGTGMTFVKHILSPKDKRIFMIVIPLQVFANVAEIIIDESEEGDVEHRMWLDVFTFVDLICCFAILFPIVWSIKHLQDASQTDGKVAINLRKLKLFRHFYIMIVCYIYFTRIIVYLLKMTVPFQYSWLDEMFREIITFVFYVLTGYKFRPASENPYFHVPEEDDNDTEIVFSQCGFTEGLTKVNRIINETGDEDRDTLLISKHESSHDYD